MSQHFDAHLFLIYDMSLFLVLQSWLKLSFTLQHSGEQMMAAQMTDKMQHEGEENLMQDINSPHF